MRKVIEGNAWFFGSNEVRLAGKSVREEESELLIIWSDLCVSNASPGLQHLIQPIFG